MYTNSAARLEGGRSIHATPDSRKPLVSIITVVYNDCSELNAILTNLAEFQSPDMEVIVIDGHSKDGTIELLRKWDDRIHYWLSEPDAGIYDAMNKAQRVATGHFLFHLNAGDRLLTFPKAELERVCKDGLDVASFRVSVDGTREALPNGGLLLRLKNSLHHQGTFYRRETFPQYDLQFPRLADFDVNQRLLLRGAKIKTFDTVVASHASGGACDNPDVSVEHAAIIRKNFGRHYLVASTVLHEWKGIKARRKAAAKRWLQARRCISTDHSE